MPYVDLDGLPPIKVVGVGGGGCNAVNRMIQEHIAGVQFVFTLAVNAAARYFELRSERSATTVPKGMAG